MKYNHECTTEILLTFKAWWKIPMLSFVLFCLTSASWAQQQVSKADRYVDVHLRYEDASCPIEKSDIKHFVYFSKDRELIKDHPFIYNTAFSGAQIMYSWDQLEPQKDQYDFTLIQEDYEYLKEHGKKLFIQLQDATFNPHRKAVPAYLLSSEYDSGVVPQLDDDGNIEGWVSKRWNSKVQERFALLLVALGEKYDGVIEGINLQESSIGVSEKIDSSFSSDGYFNALKTNMLSLKKAFPNSVTMQYANFMSGEWLPWDDHGYLKGIYNYGEEIGVGLGGPDLMITRKAQLNHTLAMMHESEYTVPLGIAVQDGNYIGQTGNLKVVKERKNLVPVLYAFAEDFLKVDYIFWVNQKPYFEEDVLPCLK